jgi:superfamily II DNA/RNA helicase
MNKNLFITITREIGSEKYRALIEYLNHPLIMKCRGILVYTRTKRIMMEVYNYLLNSGLTVSIYHSALTNKEKTDTISNFRTGVIRIVIATTALGMGLDF